MEKYNYIVKLDLTQEEANTFSMLGPVLALSVKEKDANDIACILGYSNGFELLRDGFKSNPFTKNAFVALAYLQSTKHDQAAFEEFWSRLVFTDKEVERKAKEFFNMVEKENTISTEDLEAQWKLETTLDELDH
jgi:hypothetical protein